MPLTEATEYDIAEVSRQLGRPARDIAAIAARCVCGNPVVVQTAPRLSNGEPFPTMYYLTHKGATAAISTLEASGYMAELQAELGESEELGEAYRRAHASYLAERDELEALLGLGCRLCPLAHGRHNGLEALKDLRPKFCLELDLL